MIVRDTVVIGASAGGIDALRHLLAAVPAGLRAAVCVVVHTGRDSPGTLPALLQTDSLLPVTMAVDGAGLLPGTVVVAPPDHHLVLDELGVGLSRAPSVNGHRPAVDALFRSAAAALGPRVVGIVLSGALDDGAAGLAAIQRAGGMVLVQDPADAAYPSMPRAALETVEADLVATAGALGASLPDLLLRPAAAVVDEASLVALRIEADLDRDRLDGPAPLERLGTMSVFACPQCHGTLYDLSDGSLMRFRCRIGHAFSEETLSVSKAEEEETALTAALRAVDEQAMLLRRLAEQATRRGGDRSAAHFLARAIEREHSAAILRQMFRRPSLAGAGTAAVPEPPSGAPSPTG